MVRVKTAKLSLRANVFRVTPDGSLLVWSSFPDLRVVLNTVRFSPYRDRSSRCSQRSRCARARNRCALVRSLRRCGLSANMMVADRTVHIRAQDAEGCICIVKNLNDGHPAIGEAEIILTRSLKQFRLEKIEVCCGLQKLVRAMMLQGCRTADRA